MGIQLHGAPHNVGALNKAAGKQLHIVHRVKQLAVGGLKAVDLRQGAGEDHAHGVGHIVALQGVHNGLRLHSAGTFDMHIFVQLPGNRALVLFLLWQ